MDIAFPNKNEKAFNKEGVVFIYPYKKHFQSGLPYGFLSDKPIKPLAVYQANGEDRSAFERGVDIIYNLEASKQRDFIFSRRSGLNQVLAKIARDKGVTIGFSFSLFKHAANKAKILGRMRHNMRLCQKYSVKTLIGSFAERPEDITSNTALHAFERLLKKKKLY